MTDAITIMANGDHGNVATVFAGVTPKLEGYDVGKVPSPLQRKGVAIDVTNYAALRLELTVAEMLTRFGVEGGGTRLYVEVEHSPDGQNWSLLHAFEPAHVTKQRFVATGFEKFVRASWFFARPNQVSEMIKDGVTVEWSLLADGVPGAA